MADLPRLKYIFLVIVEHCETLSNLFFRLQNFNSITIQNIYMYCVYQLWRTKPFASVAISHNFIKLS